MLADAQRFNSITEQCIYEKNVITTGQTLKHQQTLGGEEKNGGMKRKRLDQNRVCSQPYSRIRVEI